MLQVRVTAPLKPSEDPKKVERAAKAVFPDAAFAVRGDRIEGTADSLEHFQRLVWKAKILDAARRVLLGSLRTGGNTAAFDLNKQAAFAGQVSFAVGEAPLGDLHVEVEGDDLEALFKSIAPPTLRGRPVTEEEYERHLLKKRRAKAQVEPRAAWRGEE